MSTKALHKVTALKWLKSCTKMEALFRLESELVTAIAQYNLAKATQSSELVAIVEHVHDLINEYESVICSDVPLVQPKPHKDERQSLSKPLDVSQALGCTMQSTTTYSPPPPDVALAKSVQINSKPNNWDSLSLEERIAYSQHHVQSEQIQEVIVKKTNPKKQNRKQVESRV